MQPQWHLAEYSPYNDAFEEALHAEGSSPSIIGATMRAVIEIQRHPLRGQFAVVGGKSLYVVRIDRTTSPDTEIPPLLIVYTIDEDEHSIHPLLVCRASGSEQPVEEAKTLLPKVTEILGSADGWRRPAERKILFPIEPTSIDKRKLEESVKRVVAKRKAM